MAVSITQSELKELLGVPSTVADFAIAAETAILLVNEELLTSGMTEARLNKIALFLAAHFVTIGVFHGGLSSKEMGESRERYQESVLGMGYNGTLFGQQALALDHTGTLVSTGSTKLRALFSVIQPTVA